MSLFTGKPEIQRHGYWPSVADLFMTLFIVMAAVLTATVVAIMPRVATTGEDASDLISVKASDLLRVRVVSNNIRKSMDQVPWAESRPEPKSILNGIETDGDAIIALVESLHAKLKELEDRIDDQNLMVDRLQPNQSKLALLEEEFQRLKQELTMHQVQVSKLTTENESLAEINKRIKQELELLSDKPPIIQIDERNRTTRFASGEALVGEEFRRVLSRNHFRSVADEIIKRNQNGRTAVDTLEIIGHTDAAPVNSRGNLDDLLPNYFLRGLNVSFLVNLNAGSNLDLGMMRALAVKVEWQRYLDEILDPMMREKLAQISIRCYSAGQTIPPVLGGHRLYRSLDFEFPRDDARRIEIRLTKLGQ